MNSLFLAFSMPGGPEWILIFVIIIIFFGAKRLPELARSLGRSTQEFKNARKEFDDELKRAQSDLDDKDDDSSSSSSSSASSKERPALARPESTVPHSGSGETAPSQSSA